MDAHIPLAERLRPRTLDRYVGQSHLVGPGRPLRRLLEAGLVPSLILWGPPGVGKTTLAQVMAQQVRLPFRTLSAVSAGVREVREVIELARRQGKTVLFIDEIHRFHKGQQDALLGAVEKGWITLVGATTENPSFELNAALLSRCQVFRLQPLADDDLLALARHALTAPEGLAHVNVELAESAALLRHADGDARRLLNLLELAADALADSPSPRQLDDALVAAVTQRPPRHYDRQGEQHYDITSAFIKSIRGSDPHAAIYWLARMIEGGEDAKFIARRMLILAAEDIGNANPTALVMANNCFQAVQAVGFPEADIILSQVVIYLALSPKSNSAYRAIRDTRQRVRDTGDLPVPLALRNAPTRLMRQEGYGQGYRYAHEYPGNFVRQNFLPDALRGTRFYEPADNPREREFAARLAALWKEHYGY